MERNRYVLSLLCLVLFLDNALTCETLPFMEFLFLIQDTDIVFSSVFSSEVCSCRYITCSLQTSINP